MSNVYVQLCRAIGPQGVWNLLSDAYSVVCQVLRDYIAVYLPHSSFTPTNYLGNSWAMITLLPIGTSHPLHLSPLTAILITQCFCQSHFSTQKHLLFFHTSAKISIDRLVKYSSRRSGCSKNTVLTECCCCLMQVGHSLARSGSSPINLGVMRRHRYMHGRMDAWAFGH